MMAGMESTVMTDEVTTDQNIETTLSTEVALLAHLIPAQINLATSIYIGVGGVASLAVDAQNTDVRHNK
jgi:hypothetical protein